MNYSWNGKRIANPSPLQKLAIIFAVVVIFLITLPAMIPTWFIGWKSPYDPATRNIAPGNFHFFAGILFWVLLFVVVL